MNRRELMQVCFGSFVVATGAAGFGAKAIAGSLPVPSETPILTVSGRISNTNIKDAAQFDRAMLEKLGMVRVETTTPWHQGVVVFEGVPLKTLMEHVGATGDRVQAIALNDYITEIPMSDFAKFNVIMAIKRNGEYMPVRDKGPLFIVYPYDSSPELKSQTYYGRSAWQLAQLVVR